MYKTLCMLLSLSFFVGGVQGATSFVVPAKTSRSFPFMQAIMLMIAETLVDQKQCVFIGVGKRTIKVELYMQSVCGWLCPRNDCDAHPDDPGRHYCGEMRIADFEDRGFSPCRTCLKPLAPFLLAIQVIKCGSWSILDNVRMAVERSLAELEKPGAAVTSYIEAPVDEEFHYLFPQLGIRLTLMESSPHDAGRYLCYSGSFAAKNS